MKNKEYRLALIAIALNLSVVMACAWDSTHREPVEEQWEEEWTEEDEDIIRWKADDVVEEIQVEPLEIETVTQLVKEPEMVSLGKFRLTAYCPCIRCTDGDGLTSLNIPPVEGRTVAVDPSVIPYGSVLIINGHEYVAEDCGGKWIKDKEIDIFMDSHSDASAWGIQYAEVYVKVESNE